MADVKKVIEIIDKIIADVDEQKLFLTELDNVIGDGDHGITCFTLLQAYLHRLSSLLPWYHINTSTSFSK